MTESPKPSITFIGDSPVTPVLVRPETPQRPSIFVECVTEIGSILFSPARLMLDWLHGAEKHKQERKGHGF